MAREEVHVDLTAKDDTSRPAEDVAEAVGKIPEHVETTVTADTGGAVTDLNKVGGAADKAATDVRKVGDSSDQSRSVLANLVGNSAQDLGALGGVAGSAGVAIGQLAEYAADGNIALGGLIKTAGPLLAIATAVSFITSKMADAERQADELREANERIVESLRAGDIEQAAEEIESQYRDVFVAAERLGVSAENVTRVMTGQADTLGFLGSQTDGLTDAEQNLVIAVDSASRALQDQNGSTSANTARQAEIASTLGDTTTALNGAEQATKDLTAAYDVLTGRLDDEASYLSAQGAIDAVNDALADVMTATAEYGEGSEEAQDANRRLAEQLNDSKGQVLDYAGAVASLPPEQATEITTLIDEGNFAAAERRLAESNGSASPISAWKCCSHGTGRRAIRWGRRGRRPPSPAWRRPRT